MGSDMNDEYSATTSKRPRRPHDLSDETLAVIRAAVRESKDDEIVPESSRTRATLTEKTSEPEVKKRPARGRARKIEKMDADAPKLKRVFAKVRAKHVILTVLVLMVAFKPWWIVLAFAVPLLIGSLVTLALGPDRCIEFSKKAWTVFGKRYPDRAYALEMRLRRNSAKIDLFLKKMPAWLVGDLAMPQWDNDVRRARADEAFAKRLGQLSE